MGKASRQDVLQHCLSMAEDNILEEDNVKPFFPLGGHCPTIGRPINCPQIVLLLIFKQRDTGKAKITEDTLMEDASNMHHIVGGHGLARPHLAPSL